MKQGDRVRHKLSGDKMTIIKINETIAVCRMDEVIISERFGMEIWTAICAIENLEVIEENDPKADLTGSASGTVDTNIQQLNLF